MSAFESYFLIDQKEILTNESDGLGNLFAIGYSGSAFKSPAGAITQGQHSFMKMEGNIAEMVPAVNILDVT